MEEGNVTSSQPVKENPTPEQLGIMILHELRSIRKDMKEGGKNLRKKLDSVCTELNALQENAENLADMPEATASNS